MKIDDKTVFLIGSGPSLKKLNIKKLKKYTTLALNRSYIAYDDWGFSPTFYFSGDSKLIRTIIDDIKNLVEDDNGIKKIFFMRPLNLKYDAKLNKKIGSLEKKYKKKLNIFEYSSSKFLSKKKLRTKNSLKGVKLNFAGNGGACALQALYLLGFEKIILLGIDAKYKPREKSIKAGKDLSHFHPNYFDVNKFKEGAHQGADGEDSLIRFWEIISKAEKKIDNLKIYSSTPNSPINDLFEYVEFKKWFEK